MTLLIAPLVVVGAFFGLGFVAAMWRYRRRALIAEERMEAARSDAAGLAKAFEGLQEALAAGLPVNDFNPGMPRTEAIFFEALEQDLRRSRLQPVRFRRSPRRAKRPASQT